MAISVSRPSLGAEELRAVEDVFRSGWLGQGSVTRRFEEALERHLGCKHAVAVNTGTSALHIALSAFGIGRGDEVVVPSITFAASVQAILATGATPVFADVEERTMLVDVADVARRIGLRTRAVMPVHLYGSACDMAALLALAERHGFWVVEDAAHAFGTVHDGRHIGSFGHATCFSFDPIKTVTCGEGGAVTLADDARADAIRRLRVLGITPEAGPSGHREVVSAGFRYHLPDFCAAIGLAQLAKVDAFVARRREICRAYDAAFAELRHVRLRPVDWDVVAPHIYVVRVQGRLRADVMAALRRAGADSGVHYVANHLQPFFRPFATEPLPVAERVWQEILTLPLHCDMTDADVRTVVDAVVAWDRGTTA
jgi:dTDP-4-amino-4,6-dideoxygalactose transaminase